MFDYRESGREQPGSLDCGPTGPIVVQPVRLSTEPFAAGAWVLPSISADIPIEMTWGKSATAFIGAGIALEAHAEGVRLPAGDFTTVKDTLLRQLTAYVSKKCNSDEPVQLALHLDIEEDEVELVLYAQNSLEVVVLKPLIERLDEFAAGLGWFVYDVIRAAGGKYPIYDDSAIAYFCELLWFDPSLTDTEYAESELEINGEKRNGRTDAEIIEALTAGYRPSHLREIYDGHEWMLGVHHFRNGKNEQIREKPRALTLREVQHVLKKDVPDDLRQVLTDVLSLRRQIKRKSQRVHSARHQSDEDGDYNVTPYGASSIAVWNWSIFHSEIIGHFEECEMNGGESDTVHMRFKADPNDQQSVNELVRSFKDVVAWHSAVGRVLKHFPKG